MSKQAGNFNRYTCVRRAAASAALAMVLATGAYAGENPGYDRPGLGFSPAVLQAGDFTWEQGLPDWNRADGTSLYTADTLLRLGLGGPLELQLGTSWNRLSAPHQVTSGRGDSSVGLKFALPSSGRFSWGLLGSATFTDGAREFRGTDRQYLLGAAFNWQLNPRDALGAYLENVHSAGRNDHLVAFNAGRALTGTLGAYVEVAWQHTDGIDNGTMAGAGVTWQPTPSVQFDASFRHRVGGRVDTWRGGLGVSIFFGHL